MATTAVMANRRFTIEDISEEMVIPLGAGHRIIHIEFV